MEDAERLTTLLHIRIALSIFVGSSTSLLTVHAFLLPSSARLRIFILPTVVNAVSAEENTADKKSKINKIKRVATSLGSKV